MLARLMGLKTVSPTRLQQLLSDGQVTVLDVNSRQSWMKTRVPGARNPDPASFVASELPADKQQALVFYCSGPLCSKAPNAARRATRVEHENVSVMSAGIRGWLAARLPTESGPDHSQIIPAGEQA